MESLSVKRNRMFSIDRYKAAAKQEKQSGVAKTSDKPAQIKNDAKNDAVSQTLKRLMEKLDQTTERTRESGRLLQNGESTLAVVQEKLKRMAELIDEAGLEGADRDAIQSELEKLFDEIDRVIKNASAGDGALFREEGLDNGVSQLYGGLEEELETLFKAVFSFGSEDTGKVVREFPDWLLKGMSVSGTEGLLEALGLDGTASAQEVYKALTKLSVEDDAAAARLFALYLGTVISGGGEVPEEIDLAVAAMGLRRLMEKLAEGVQLDDAIRDLTNGAFDSLMELETLFGSGSAPGLMDFLGKLLLTDGGAGMLIADGSLSELELLSGLGSVGFDLLMGVVSASQEADAGAVSVKAEQEAEGAVITRNFGTFEVSGKELSGVRFDAARGTLTVSGSEDVTITRQASQTGQTAAHISANRTEGVIVLESSGNVTLKNTVASGIVINSADARIINEGENHAGTVAMRKGSSVSFAGSGMLNTVEIKGDRSNTIVMEEGAVSVAGGNGKIGGIVVQMNGFASFAAQAANVYNREGVRLEPFDVIWKALLPNWSSITDMALDGKMAKFNLFNREINPDAVRLWLDTSHGHPVQKLLIYGREDKTEQPESRYAFLKWEHREKRFREILMYPNPFEVTGGEEGIDWEYEEEAHILRLLTGEVTGIAGGPGIDAEMNPFSGRIAVKSNLGAIDLKLMGVDCRVESGRAFELGRENNVTLIIGAGTENVFESGRGCAGISIGDGSSLTIEAGLGDTEAGEKPPAGTLFAEGGLEAAGIGRDSAGSWDRTSSIRILGGIVTAYGKGSGAGIGAGRNGTMGDITIAGGRVDAKGGRTGGAGIGGAFGAPVKDITITGGSVSAEAFYHAAAIGAGVQGECGDVLISGNAKILKAKGGDPGADIGACVFGKAGKVRIRGKADIGGSGIKEWKDDGLRLQIGSERLEIPRFSLSARALLLNKLSVSDDEKIFASKGTVSAAARKISRIKAAYNALCNQLERSVENLGSAHEYISAVEELLVRDIKAANELLTEAKRSIVTRSGQAMKSHTDQGSDDVLRLIR